MFHKNFRHQYQRTAKAIGAALMVLTTSVIAPRASDAQQTTGTFYSQNQPVATGDAFLDGLLNGAQRDLSRDILRSYLNGMENRMDQALQPMEQWFGPVQGAVRTWMHSFFTDERQRLGISDATPTASSAITQQFTNSNTTPTGMDQVLMDDLLGFARREFQSIPGEDALIVGVRQFIQDIASRNVQPDAIRQMIANKPWLGRLVARFAANHPELLARNPWLTDSLTPYMQDVSQTSSSSNGTLQTSRLVIDDSNQQRADTTNTGATNPNSANQSANQMTQAQFRASMDQMMRQFQEADARNQAILQQQRAQIQANASAAAPVQPTVAPSTQVSALRNGYDENGNLANSPRSQYDSQGYYTSGSGNSSNGSTGDFFNNAPAQPATPAPARQNRVYFIDGTSRLIGRGNNYGAQQFQAMQQWSQQQIAQQQAFSQPSNANNGSYSAPGSQSTVPTPNTTNASNGWAGPSQQLIVVDTPRGQSTGASNSTFRPSTSNNGPAVAPRSNGVQSQTAGLQFP